MGRITREIFGVMWSVIFYLRYTFHCILQQQDNKNFIKILYLYTWSVTNFNINYTNQMQYDQVFTNVRLNNES